MSKGDKSSKDKVVLSYYDSLLRIRDVNLLRGPYWLNDTIIGFYFEYLEHNRPNFTEDEKEILFLSPEFTQLLKLTYCDNYEDLFESIGARRYNYILFPLNNCESMESAGGSHWSLLAFSKNEKIFLHLDSCRGMNKRIASRFVDKIKDYFMDSNGESCHYRETNCPQQDNKYDCGLYTICLADIIVQHVETESNLLSKCKFDNVRSIVDNKREYLLDLIDELGGAQQKSTV